MMSTAIGWDDGEDEVPHGALVCDLAEHLVGLQCADVLGFCRRFLQRRLGYVPRIIMREAPPEGLSPYQPEDCLVIHCIGRHSFDLFFGGMDVHIGPAVKESWER